MTFDKKAYDLKYHKEHYKRINLPLLPSEYDRLKAHATATGESVNGFIKRAIAETITSDESKTE